MLYWLPLVCSIVLGGMYVFGTDASVGSKMLVALFVIASLVMHFVFPALWLIALLIQVIVSIGILLYMKVNH
jgi:hypothetical protein